MDECCFSGFRVCLTEGRSYDAKRMERDHLGLDATTPWCF